MNRHKIRKACSVLMKGAGFGRGFKYEVMGQNDNRTGPTPFFNHAVEREKGEEIPWDGSFIGWARFKSEIEDGQIGDVYVYKRDRVDYRLITNVLIKIMPNFAMGYDLDHVYLYNPESEELYIYQGEDIRTKFWEVESLDDLDLVCNWYLIPEEHKSPRKI